MGRRRKGGDEMTAVKKAEIDETPAKLQEGIKDLFKDDKWDKKKMVRGFLRNSGLWLHQRSVFLLHDFISISYQSDCLTVDKRQQDYYADTSRWK